MATYWWFQATKKPANFPPGPGRLPVVGGAPYIMVGGSIIHSFRYLVDKYGPISGVYFGSIPTVVITDYEILKGNNCFYDKLKKITELSYFTLTMQRPS